MKEIGIQFKKRREELNLTFSEISVQTKINTKILQAMEEGDLKKLPAKSFLRGFVSTYAKFLKMDSDKILEQFQEEMGSTKPQPKELKPPTVDFSRGFSFFKKKSNQKAIGSAIVILILVFVIFSVKEVFEKYQRETAINPVANTLTPAVPDEEKSTEALNVEIESLSETEGQSEENKEDEKTNVVAAKKEEQKKPASVTEDKEKSSAAEKQPVEKKEVKVAEVKKVEPEKEDTKKEKEAQKPEEKPKEKVSTKNQQIIIEALDEVEVEYKTDQGRQKSKTLKPGHILIINADKVIDLEISDGGAINLTHNGINKGVPGRLGKSLEVIYQ